MSARPADLPICGILRQLCERLEELCDQQESYDLKVAIAVIEELAVENPRLESKRLLLQRTLEADDLLLDELHSDNTAPRGRYN